MAKQHYVPKFLPTTTTTRTLAEIINLPVNQKTSPFSSTLNFAMEGGWLSSSIPPPPVKTDCKHLPQARGKSSEDYLPNSDTAASWQDVNVSAVCK
jgi:hypothetical protein